MNLHLKNYKIIFQLLIILGILQFSCKKNEFNNSETNYTEPSAYSQNGIPSYVANSLNVVDDIGRLHNEAMYDIILDNDYEIEYDTLYSEGAMYILGADWKKIGHADVSGALGGLATIGTSALFVPVTWTYVAAAGLGGGVGNSVMELYNQWVAGGVAIFWYP